jgi:signal transduction histidine kinase
MTKRSRMMGWALVIAAVIGAVLQDRFTSLAQHSYGAANQLQLEILISLGCIFLISVGAVIVAHQPRNIIGWLVAAIGFSLEYWSFAQSYAAYALNPRPRATPFHLPFGAIVGWASLWVLPFFISLYVGILLLFPDGKPSSRRWRPVVWVWGTTTVVALMTFGLDKAVTGFGNGNCPPLPGDAIACVNNPITSSSVRYAVGVVSAISGLVLFATAIAALLSVIIRFRRAKGDERQQIKWIAFLGVAFWVMFFVNIVLFGVFGQDSAIPGASFSIVVGILLIGLPLAIAVSVLKYRLYDLDVVVRKTVVVGILVAFIAVVYVIIVAGIGALIGSRSNTALSFVAAAVLAITFQPARERARRLADRLVYGRRATPYEVLTRFSDQMSGAYADVDVLPRMAQILGEGTGATSATIWMLTDGVMRDAASWPAGSAGGSFPNDAVEVRHEGEVLGAVSVEMPASDPMDPSKRKLLEGLAAQAGVVLRNVRLIDELKASRQRLVAAQDEERRKIERNIHDGAQQQLVALTVKLRLAEQSLDRDLDKAREILGQIQGEAQTALEDLRDLARGIYPPLLADSGLAAALTAQAKRAAVPTSVAAADVGRFPQDVEVAVYFCALEALNNVAKYSGANSAHVMLARNDGHLSFEVTDDGVGFDPRTSNHGTGLQGMADRLDLVGGTLLVESSPGAGTTIRGNVPVVIA